MVCAHLGVDGDLGDLIDRLAVIKCHHPHEPSEAESSPPAPTNDQE